MASPSKNSIPTFQCETFRYTSACRRPEEKIPSYAVPKSSFLPQKGSIRLAGINIKLDQFNIDEPFNKVVFTSEDSKTTYAGVISPGNYTLDNIAPARAGAMNSSSKDFEVQKFSVSVKNNCLQIKHQNNFMPVFDENRSNILWQKLGFESNENSKYKTLHLAKISPNLTRSGDYFLELQGLICSCINGNSFNVAGFPLILKENIFELASWKNKEGSFIRINGGCGHMVVRLYDSNRELVNLHSDWSFLLENVYE
jgi:hypothetical protein